MARRRGCSAFEAAIFPTGLGWMFAVAENERLERLGIGYHTPEAAWTALTPDEPRLSGPANSGAALKRLLDTEGWLGDVVARVQAYVSGTRDDFRDLSVALPTGSDFKLRVLEACRLIGYGQSMSYRELAERAGYPGAARAVGQVMAHNHVPLVIPCHRVIASGGRPGGFSARGGLALKEKLLAIEGQWPPKSRRTVPARRLSLWV